MFTTSTHQNPPTHPFPQYQTFQERNSTKNQEAALRSWLTFFLSHPFWGAGVSSRCLGVKTFWRNERRRSHKTFCTMGNFLPVFWRNMSAVGSSLRLVPSRGHLNCLKSTGSGRMLEGFFQWHNKLAWQVWNGVEKLLTLGFVMASGQNQVLFENQAKLGRRHHQHCSAIFFNPWNPWDFVLAPSGSLGEAFYGIWS